MTSQSSHILRIKQSATSGANVLLHITQTRAGSLDLKLIATEQEHLYHTIIKESSLRSIQAERYEGTLEDFKSILRTNLLQEAPNKSSEKPNDIEITASIDDDTLTISLRRDTAGIKSPVCSIVCVQDDEREAISFPEWVDTALATSESAHARCRALQASVSSFEEQILKLTAQLDDFVSAKKAHEEEMLKKFAMLLNAKKLKVRDQQRLIGDLSSGKSTSNIKGYDGGTEQSTKIPKGEFSIGHRSAINLPRTGKRKASNNAEDDELMVGGDKESGTEDDDAGVSMQQSTPTPEPDDDSADDAFTAAYPLSQASRPDARSGAHQDDVGHVRNVGSGTAEEVPQRRALPFGNAKDIKTSPKAVNDESTDDDSDEI